MAKTIASQRLLPAVVQGMLRGYEKPEQTAPYVDAIEYAKNHYFLPEPSAVPSATGGPVPASGAERAPHTPAPIGAAYEAPAPVTTPHPGRPVSTPLSPQAAAQMAKAGIPSFQSTGVAHSFSYEPGEESVHAITKNDGLLTEADIPPAGGSVPQMGAATPKSAAARKPDITPPLPSSPNTATTSQEKTGSGAGGGGGPVTVTGSLTIDGLPEFIARTEMRLNGLELGNQNG